MLKKMRKLILTKRQTFNDEIKCNIHSKKKLPKTTIQSNWCLRNDSSNVSAILHPEDYQQSRKTIQNIEKNQLKGAYKKNFLSTNSCYCKEKKIEPRILSRPNKCLMLEEFEQKLPEDDLYRRFILRRANVPEICFCKEIAKNGYEKLTNSQLLKTYREELAKSNGELSFTQQRKDYEDFRQEQEEEYIKEVEEYIREEEEEDQNSVSTILSTRANESKTGSSAYVEPREDVSELSQFRNDHYFETHSTEPFGSDVPEHTCIHQFKLGSRLLPEPLNVDPFGRSRCTICYEPMDGDKIQLSNSYFGDKPSRASLRNFAKGYELGLVPRAVNIGGDKSKIQLRLTEGDFEKFGVFIGRIKRPQYTNTFALRQQKMRC